MSYTHQQAIKQHEEYLFKLAKATLKWVGFKYTQEELADLVMGELFEIDQPKPLQQQIKNLIKDYTKIIEETEKDQESNEFEDDYATGHTDASQSIIDDLEILIK